MCHSLYTCIHIYEWKTSDLHRRSYVKNYFREKKTEPAIVFNTLRVCICIHFFKKCSGKAPTPPPPLLARANSRTHHYRAFALILVYTPAVNGGLASGSRTDNAMFFCFFFGGGGGEGGGGNFTTL